jgi:transposase InsO family protein
MNGLVRGRVTRTTTAAKHGGTRAPDMLNLCFSAWRPNYAWVTDFTYVATWSGFAYFAFAIDLLSCAIVGWAASTVKDTTFVEACLNMPSGAVTDVSPSARRLRARSAPASAVDPQFGWNLGPVRLE